MYRDDAERFMRQALRLARKGRGKTSPNPMVGAVVVRHGKVVGSGSHMRRGAAHAEVVAIEKAGRRARGGALFVNLEPCCHHGLTPPCVSAIVESGIESVFASIVDPDPRVSGGGFRFLRRHGVAVQVGILRNDAEELNESYLKWARTKRPFVAIKVCQSLDGRIAASNGGGRGLGSPEEIRFAHSLRSAYDAVLVGAGTVLSDDPRLTVREWRGRNPHRIVLDSRLGLPLKSRVFDRRGGERVIVAATKQRASNRKVEALKARGIEVWLLPEINGGVSLRRLLSRAGEDSIQSILVEGGSDVVTSFLKEKLADKLYVATSPKILGGTRSISWPKEIGVESVSKALPLRDLRVKRLGPDVLVEGYLQGAATARSR
ncbi:MAG: bifunctional diaminohydroxyphosphoribosylaminopyrimidine deaminase/5-amino-6-(5-phosphoribosylamino)uracil reductase RibD [Candidatus Eiseniibacteriota bacterium]|nr:MAG: bifunctional diaminohydroxyphosphoribosylaminopyrimidine deaminase/5-amino-6-(5-phosphoribosylamino)uracil reductase RibD [Candidatus Eisenbacteria bacterium]